MFLRSLLAMALMVSPVLAQDKAAPEASQGGVRKKIITSEARTKGTKTDIDFDDAAIDGERRLPSGVNVGGAKQNNAFDLINPRLSWRAEMIKSTSNLETGKGR